MHLLTGGGGLIENWSKKGDKEDPGNYRGITLLNVVGKLYSRIINNRLLKYLESKINYTKGRKDSGSADHAQIILFFP